MENHDGAKYLAGWNLDVFLRFIVKHGAVVDYAHVLHPAPRGPPVQMIDFVKGFACCLSPRSCAFASTSIRTMNDHVRSSLHDAERRPRLEDCYRSQVAVQTVFPWQARIKWFEVEPALLAPSHPDSNPLNFILQHILPERPPLGAPTATPSDRERTRFMVFMNWDTKMEEYRTNRKKHMVIKTLLLPPALSSKDALLRIKPAFVALMEKATSYFGSGSSQAFAIRKHILHGADISQLP